MANTIAYTSGNSLTGSLKSGVISINLNDQIIGQNYNWRNGIVFSNQYIIYSDTFTQGIDTEANAKPCAWACDYNDVALLNLINSLPPLIGQPKYATLASAIAWLQGQNKYFIVNQNYPIIVTDGLKFNLDAGLTGSYPVVGTTAYDTSGSVNGTLTNGTSWTNSGATSVFNFDGTDDYIGYGVSGGGIGGSSEATIDLVVKIDALKPTAGAYQQIFGFRNDSTFDFFILIFESSQSGLTEFRARNSSGTFYDMNPNILSNIGKYVHINYSLKSTGAKVYFNGVEVATGSWSGSLGTSAPFNLSSNAGAAWFLDGNVKSARLYNKQLSPSEVLQNYYQGPIITTGLNTAIDFGNLVSYSGASTTAYDLTTRANNATLQNGITYNLNEGGVVYLDGTDDFIQLAEYTSYAFGNTPTVAMWIKPIAVGTYGLLSHCSGGPVNLGYGIENGYMSYRNYDFQWNYYTSNAYVGGGDWTHVAWVKETSTSLKFYVNGVLQDTITITNTNGPINTIGSYWGPCDGGGFSMFNGWIGNVYLYSQTALSASQILQNFNAQRNRFQSNQAFANGGTVSTVIENGIRYRVHTFTSSGTLTVLSAGKMEVLTVAGGGGGGAYAAGAGAGAGGVLFNTDYSVTTGNKTVTIGAGGAGQDYTVTNPSNGSNSVMDSLTAVGGGYGGQGWSGNVGGNGGSGGGGAGYDGTQGTSTTAGGNGTPGQGFNGGIGRGISGNRGAGGGGGGAGVPGGDSTTNSSGDGGNGRQISINGTATYYGGGGGGGDYGSANGGQGGLGGGGNVSGGNGSGVLAGNGGTNTGGGGGGSRSATPDSWNGGNGGSGIVIVRYRI
jgi:hypothetical protein